MDGDEPATLTDDADPDRGPVELFRQLAGQILVTLLAPDLVLSMIIVADQRGVITEHQVMPPELSQDRVVVPLAALRRESDDLGRAE
jgi:hypothetical protein